MRTRAQGSGPSHPEEIFGALDEPREGNKKPARPNMLAKEDGDILCGTISAVSGMLVGGKGKHEAWNSHYLYGRPAVPEDFAARRGPTRAVLVIETAQDVILD